MSTAMDTPPVPSTAQQQKKGPFTLSRATPDDMPALIALQYTSFAPPIREAAMGCFSPTDIPKILAKYVAEMASDPSDLWIQVKDAESGEVVAGSNWKVYLNGPPEVGSRGSEVPGWLEGEARERSERFAGGMEGLRKRVLDGVPFLHLHICFTHPSYRRRGAGSLMLQWGCDVADLLGLVGWIEASEEGNLLYKRFGFYEHSKVEGEMGGVNMMRDAKGWAIVGGK